MNLYERKLKCVIKLKKKKQLKHIIYKAIYVATLYTYKYLYNTKYKIQKIRKKCKKSNFNKKIKVAENKSKRNNNKK